MPRRINKGNPLPHTVNPKRPNPLRDAAIFLSRNVRFPQEINKSSLPMIDVTHDCHNCMLLLYQRGYFGLLGLLGLLGLGCGGF